MCPQRLPSPSHPHPGWCVSCAARQAAGPSRLQRAAEMGAAVSAGGRCRTQRLGNNRRSARLLAVNCIAFTAIMVHGSARPASDKPGATAHGITTNPWRQSTRHKRHGQAPALHLIRSAPAGNGGQCCAKLGLLLHQNACPTTVCKAYPRSTLRRRMPAAQGWLYLAANNNPCTAEIYSPVADVVQQRGHRAQPVLRHHVSVGGLRRGNAGCWPVAGVSA